MKKLYSHSIILVILFALCGCKSTSNLISDNYNLRDSVWCISQKSIPIIYDSSLNIRPDNRMYRSLSFINYFFTKDGIIKKVENFNKDSIMIGYDEYLYSESGRFKRIISYKNGIPEYFIKVRYHTNNLMVTETADYNTHELWSVFKIRYHHGRVSGMKIRDFKKDIYNIVKFKLDTLGNELTRINEFNIYDMPDTLDIHYLEYDIAGNWTKRIENTENGGNLVLRRIKYYND